MALVSIIIPVYNTEEYLEQCLESILNQTLKDIEVICVNDGSTDNSLDILSRYKEADDRIIIIDKKNGGQISARNAGIKVATSDYIGFIDSDDWIEPEMYEELYDLAIKYNVDMVTSGYYLEGNYTTLHCDTVNEGLYCDGKMLYLRDNTIYNLNEKETGLRASLCCKLFARDILLQVKNEVPETISISEDKLCILSCVLKCDSVYVLKQAFYHYRINNASMTHGEYDDYLIRVNEVYRFFRKCYCDNCFTKNMRMQAELYITELIIKGINTLLGFENKNLLWIDPYYLERIPVNSRIVIYGAGELGKKYKKQISCKSGIQYVGCVDFGYDKYSDDNFKVESPEKLKNMDYEYILITIKNPKKAEEVKKKLLEYVKEDKILWFEQRELYWKYAEADGLL